MLQPYFWCETLAAILKDNREKKRKQNGFSLASFQPHGKAWPVSPDGDFFQIISWSGRVCHKWPELCKVPKPCYIHQTLSVCARTVAARNQILLEVIQ